MDQKPGLFSAPVPQGMPPPVNGSNINQANSGGGFFGAAATQANAANSQTQSYQLGDLARRLRMVEESVSNTRKKVEINEENTLEDQKKKANELKSVFSELDAMKKEIRQFKDEMLKMVKEFQTLAKKEDVAVLEKYIKLWEPIKYPTVEQVERMIDEKVSAAHSANSSVSFGTTLEQSTSPITRSQQQSQFTPPLQQTYASSQSVLQKTEQKQSKHHQDNQTHDIFSQPTDEDEDEKPIFVKESHIPLSAALKGQSRTKQIFDNVGDDEGDNRDEERQTTIQESPTSKTQTTTKPTLNSIETSQKFVQQTPQSRVAPEAAQNPWANFKPNTQPFRDHIAPSSASVKQPPIAQTSTMTQQTPSFQPQSNGVIENTVVNQYMQNPAKYEVSAEQKKQIASLIEEFDDVRELLLSDPQTFEKRVFADPHLAKVFKGVNIKELSARLKPHYG
jgi:hypothetical protein